VACNNGNTVIALLILRQALTKMATDPLIRLLRNPSTQRPNDRKLPESDETKSVKKLLVENETLQSVDHNGDTPLHYCCFRGHVDTATELIHRGAKVNVKNQYGQLPLQMLRDEYARQDLVQLADRINRIVKQQMRIFDIPIPYEPPSNTYMTKFAKYKPREVKKVSLDKHACDLVDAIRRLGFKTMDCYREAERVVSDPVAAHFRLTSSVVGQLETGYELFRRRNYSASSSKYHEAFERQSLADWVAKRYAKKRRLKKDVTLHILSLIRINDECEVALTDDCIHREEQGRLNAFLIARSILAAILRVTVQEVNLKDPCDT